MPENDPRRAAPVPGSARPPLAFVTPWYGPDLPGGAEALARQTVHRLQRRGLDVEVWTTTLGGLHSDWSKNEHAPGLSRVNGVPVRRFAVSRRDKTAFDALNWRLMQGLSIGPEDERVFIGEMFNAPDLYDHIRHHGADRLLFFVGYMFASTYYGAQIHPRRSAIVPCLHDEAYARLGLYHDLLRSARALIFNSQAELELAQRLYGRAPEQIWEVIGMGVDHNLSWDAQRFRQKQALSTPFVLYVGRREPGKNTPLLLDYWQRYVRESGREAKLVLMGPGDVQIPPQAASHVLDLGFAPAQDKLDAYAAATLLCQPSVHESFSIVLLESWRAGTPVLVNGNCAVTLRHCQQSNGGLYFTSYEEFAGAVSFMLDHPHLSRAMGRQGRRYVKDNFHWNVIEEKYLNLIDQLGGQTASATTETSSTV
ncbi:MAG: glycosyltransferase family 4 protein [bacterium]